jgi:glycosyltransferase involved in cell wall biosynthesis
MKRASAVIVYESSGKNNLIKLGIPKNKIFFSKNSIDIKEIIKFRDTSKKKFRITFIGRIIKDKNVSLLCKSYLNIIHKIDKSIILTIIGSGEELDDLKKLYSNNRIEFIGQLHDEKKISKFLNQTLFTVSPDYLGLSIIHSFCYSVPLLVNENPNIKHSPEIELFHNNKNGWYFDGTQNDLEDKMIKFTKNNKKSTIFGQDGFNKVKSEYGIEVMVKFFIKAIRSSRY